jgi:hypothetical protein
MAVAVIATCVVASPANAQAPSPCTGAAQINDPKGDGHHANTDVVSAWLTESAGRVQAVVQIDNALWEPAHDDSDSAGVALLYQAGGQTRYVRVQMFRGAPPAYDQGTWSVATGFTSAGATTGAVTTGSKGTATLDVPGVATGTVLARPFVLSYDGITGPDAHWVDRAPGGTSPDGTEFGADFVVGSCSNPGGGGGSGGTGGGGTGGGGGTPTTPGAVRTTAIALKAPRKLTGSDRAAITGQLTPARAGVAVEITATGRTTTRRTVTTSADGSFKASLPISETTRVRAVAEGLGSQTLTVQMYSKVRIKVRRLKSGTVVVSGTTSPKLGGRILWLRSNAVRPSARTTARKGRFELRFKNPRPGRYQAVFIPSGDRAERSTSNTGVIR